MKFTITPNRGPLGTNVAVGIEAERDESIASVTVESDGSTVYDDTIDPPEVWFQKDLDAPVGYAPGTDHVVRVIAGDAAGLQRVASHRWTD